MVDQWLDEVKQRANRKPFGVFPQQNVKIIKAIYRIGVISSFLQPMIRLQAREEK
jgi:hypothetical protein